MKRGQAGIGEMSMIILTLIAMVALFSIMMPLLELGEDRSPSSICRASIQSRLSSAVSVTDNIDVSWSPLLCNTVDSIIYPDQGFWTFLQNFFDKNGENVRAKQKAMHMIAEKMVECRYMMNDARQDDYFTSLGDEFWKVAGFQGRENSCFLCSTVTLKDFKMYDDEGREQEFVISPLEFQEFMATEESPRMGVKYNDYLQGGGNIGGRSVYMIQEPIRDEEVYGILFFSKNSDAEPEFGWLAGAGGVTAMVGAGFVAYASASAAAVTTTTTVTTVAAATTTTVATTTAVATTTTAVAATSTATATTTAGAAICTGGITCVVGAVLIVAGVAMLLYAAAGSVNDAWQDNKVSFYNGQFMDDRYFSYFVVDSLSGANNAGCQVSTYAEKFQ